MRLLVPIASGSLFFQKMIVAKSRYETYNAELLAIVETFKTGKYQLEDYKYDVLVITDHNNLQHLINIQNRSLRQVCWAQKLWKYHWCIDYPQGKANTTADVLSKYPKRNTKKKNTLRSKNAKILY